ncbi:hypothetical protein DFJ73DRAFT_339437 [Zopfochytrium polystomum]|nr:hypothetical protein DFJ73DRAFT_339437 [Zopfochytrium polystomum]
MSARDTVQLLRQRQGVTLLDRNRVAFLVDKICDKLEVFNRERGSNFRIAIDAARAPADVHASELVLSNLPAAVFENFLEHALSFYSNLAELRLRGMNFEAQTLQLMKKHVVAKKTLSLLEIKDSKFFETPSDHSLEDFFRAAANAKTISKLTLSNCGFTTIGVVKSITHNFPLKELDLSSNPFGVDASFKWFAEGPSLTRLVLSNTAITNASMESLQTFVVTVATNLHMLDISKNRLTAASARQIALILANHRALRELDLHDNALGEQGGVEIAAALATNSTLKSLSLKSTGIQKTSALALASALGTNSTLASLNLLKSSIMTGGAIAILLSRAVEAGTLSNLEIDGTFLAEGFHRKTKELVLAGRNLHEDSILPKVLPSLKELERLVLKGTRIGESPETLALYTSHLNDFALLAHLDFSFCRISIVDGLADALKSNTTLKGLNLRGNEIDDASFEILAEAVKSNTCLIVLDLRDNYMGDSSAPFVEDLMLRNARIELLLSASKFEDQSVLRGMARVNLFNEGDDPSVVSGKAEDYT